MKKKSQSRRTSIPTRNLRTDCDSSRRSLGLKLKTILFENLSRNMGLRGGHSLPSLSKVDWENSAVRDGTIT